MDGIRQSRNKHIATSNDVKVPASTLIFINDFFSLFFGGGGKNGVGGDAAIKVFYWPINYNTCMNFDFLQRQ